MRMIDVPHLIQGVLQSELAVRPTEKLRDATVAVQRWVASLQPLGRDKDNDVSCDCGCLEQEMEVEQCLPGKGTVDPREPGGGKSDRNVPLPSRRGASSSLNAQWLQRILGELSQMVSQISMEDRP